MIVEQFSLLIGMTLVIFFLTTLYGKRTPFFSLAISLMLGISLAYLAIFTMQKVYVNNFLELLKGDYKQIIPLILGVTVLSSVKSKYAYLARIPLSIAVGTQLALTTRSIIFTKILDMIVSVITPLYTSGNLYENFCNIVALISTITILSFFIYTFRRKSVLKQSSTIGEYLLYVSMGGLIASEFLGWNGTALGVLSRYLKPISNAYLFIGISLVVLVSLVVLDKYDLLEKYAE